MAAAESYVSLATRAAAERASLLDKTQALRVAWRVVAHVGASALRLLFAGVRWPPAQRRFLSTRQARGPSARIGRCASPLHCGPNRRARIPAVRSQPGVLADGVDSALLCRRARAAGRAGGEQVEQSEQGPGRRRRRRARARLIEPRTARV